MQDHEVHLGSKSTYVRRSLRKHRLVAAKDQQKELLIGACSLLSLLLASAGQGKGSLLSLNCQGDVDDSGVVLSALMLLDPALRITRHEYRSLSACSQAALWSPGSIGAKDRRKVLLLEHMASLAGSN
jgi:hypothetical protein